MCKILSKKHVIFFLPSSNMEMSDWSTSPVNLPYIIVRLYKEDLGNLLKCTKKR